MSYKNYKEGTGVRARSDLTANRLPERLGKITDEQIVKVVEYLSKEAKAGRTVHLRPELSLKLCDVLLEAVNRIGEP